MLKQSHKKWMKLSVGVGVVFSSLLTTPSVIAFQDAASVANIETLSTVRWRLHFAATKLDTAGMVAHESFDHVPYPAGHISEAFVVQDALPHMLTTRNLTTRHLKSDRLDSAKIVQNANTATVNKTVEAADGTTPRQGVLLASLTPDAVELPLFLAPMPMMPPPDLLKAPDFNKKTEQSLMSRDKNLAKERKCLAEAIYFEARGEPERGQYAVAQVVMNRVRSQYYPDTVCGVVYQNKHLRNRCQFSFACDRIPDRVTNRKSWTLARRIAFEVMQEGHSLPEVGGSTHYHATYVRPRWIREMRKEARIGRHLFYTVPRWTNQGA